MFTEYTRLAVDEDQKKVSTKGKYSFVWALIFALAGVCAVGKFLHEHSLAPLEESVAETPVGGCVVNAGLAQINKVGVGLEAELQTRRWYSEKVRDPVPGKENDLKDLAVKWSCAWGYKHLLGSVYWSAEGDTNDETTLAFQITGEEHCVIELITPPRDVHNDAADQPVMLAAILGIMRMRQVMNSFKTLTLGEAFALLNAKKETDGATDPKDKKGWSLMPQFGKYRIVWEKLSVARDQLPGALGPWPDSIKGILKDQADYEDAGATFFSECKAREEPNFEYGSPSKLVWQANVNVPIFFWDINDVKPQMLKGETSFPLATLKAFGTDRTALQQLTDPIIRSLVGYWRNAELTYDSGREDGYVKKIEVRRAAAPSRGGVLPPNPKNYNPWYNKANLVGKSEGGWTQGASAIAQFEKMFDKTKPNNGFDREIDPALYNEVPYVVVESRWGTNDIVQKLKSDTSTWDSQQPKYKYSDYAAEVGQFFFKVTGLQDPTKYGGYSECFPK